MRHHVGIYPGTFDPIHQGHISFALRALRICNLDQIVFLPEPTPRGKDSVTTITTRIAGVKKAISDNSKLSVFSPSSAQFTVHDTLPELHRAFGDADLTLLVGSDIVRTFGHRWQNLDLLLQSVSLAIGMRSGDTTDAIVAIIKQLERQYNLTIRYALINTNDSHRASSYVRNSSILSSDILAQQFGATRLVILRQNDNYRIIQTIASDSNVVLELSLVTFNQVNVQAFPTVHQAIIEGESIGVAYQKEGILFKRHTAAINHILLPAKLAKYFSTKEPATVIEVDILVGPRQTHYCSILEIYSPAVQWPESDTLVSPSLRTRLQEFSKLL